MEVGGTYGLVFVDWVLDAAGVLGHPGGVEHGHTGHAQDGGGQGEVYTGRRDLEHNRDSQPLLKVHCTSMLPYHVPCTKYLTMLCSLPC